MKQKINSDHVSKLMFVFSLGVTFFFYGYAVHRFKAFPYEVVETGYEQVKLVLSSFVPPWHYQQTTHTETIPIYDPSAASNGLSLVTAIVADNALAVTVINMEGEVIHQWDTDWFRVWPDATHVPADQLPKSRPGTHVHGALLLENGDLIFNYEHFGLVRLDICGDIVWRFPHRTHHSIYQDENDNLWVSGQVNHEKPVPEFPNYTPPFIEPKIFIVSLDGEMLAEISIMELLQANNLEGLLLMSSIDNGLTPFVTGDTLHLNDVERFPDGMAEGVFKTGDVMVSLRNINTVFIFNEADLKIKHVITGEFVRQHDPDFIDGNTISIFDNNNIALPKHGHQSKILIRSMVDHQSEVYYTGTEENRFYTHIMGKHEWLPNGNMLITDSVNGRGFEIDPAGNIVWEYINLVEDGYVGIVQEVHRLPDGFTEAFFEETAKKCTAKE